MTVSLKLLLRKKISCFHFVCTVVIKFLIIFLLTYIICVEMINFVGVLCMDFYQKCMLCLISFSTQLQLSSMDRRVLGAGYIPYVLRQCVYDVENATSHAMVTTAILRLSSHLVACAQYLDSSVFQSLGWTDVLTRSV